jgi:predicted ATPase
MGHFLAVLAGSGVQVVVETHSDHVVNGIRRAIGEFKVLPYSDAVIHFFDAAADGSPQVFELRVTPTGSISAWPPRFFDQYQIDVAALSKVRRSTSS